MSSMGMPLKLDFEPWCSSSMCSCKSAASIESFLFLDCMIEFEQPLANICHIHFEVQKLHTWNPYIGFRPRMVWEIYASSMWTLLELKFLPNLMSRVECPLVANTTHPFKFFNKFNLIYFFRVARSKSNSLGLIWFLESASAMWMLPELEFQLSWR